VLCAAERPYDPPQLAVLGFMVRITEHGNVISDTARSTTTPSGRAMVSESARTTPRSVDAEISPCLRCSSDSDGDITVRKIGAHAIAICAQRLDRRSNRRPCRCSGSADCQARMALNGQ
jgi:hypothetical protein